MVYQPGEQKAWVYIMTNKSNGILYVGVTHDLCRRVYEHREGLVDGFTRKYGLKILVYFEGFPLMMQAVDKEKEMKNWKRAWKVRRIFATNPEWRDLYGDIVP